MKKLSLQRETVKVLTDRSLAQVGGGTSNSWGGCPTNGCTDYSVWQTCGPTRKLEDL